MGLIYIKAGIIVIISFQMKKHMTRRGVLFD